MERGSERERRRERTEGEEWGKGDREKERKLFLKNHGWSFLKLMTDGKAMDPGIAENTK